MKKERVYIGMGGNIGNSVQILNTALQQIQQIAGVDALFCSRFYRTSAVSSIPQGDFVNAVCTFQTLLSPKMLLRQLQKIETKLGKVDKDKEEPRVIDLDLLLHGSEVINDQELSVPHPKWKERLFVLVPLHELVDELEDPLAGVQVSLKNMLENFNNIHQETLSVIAKPEVEK